MAAILLGSGALGRSVSESLRLGPAGERGCAPLPWGPRTHLALLSWGPPRGSEPRDRLASLSPPRKNLSCPVPGLCFRSRKTCGDRVHIPSSSHSDSGSWNIRIHSTMTTIRVSMFSSPQKEALGPLAATPLPNPRQGLRRLLSP